MNYNGMDNDPDGQQNRGLEPVVAGESLASLLTGNYNLIVSYCQSWPVTYCQSWPVTYCQSWPVTYCQSWPVTY